MDGAMPFNDDLVDRLVSLTHALRAQLHEAVLAESEALTEMGARALAFIMRQPGSTSSELVEHARRDKGQVARVIAQLEESGLIVREPSPTDRRMATLNLTDRGRAIQKKMQAHRQRVVDAMLRGVSKQERSLVAAVLQRMHDALGRGKR